MQINSNILALPLIHCPVSSWREHANYISSILSVSVVFIFQMISLICLQIHVSCHTLIIVVLFGQIVVMFFWIRCRFFIIYLLAFSYQQMLELILMMMNSLNWVKLNKGSEKHLLVVLFNASVKGNLELPLLKGRRRFDVETTSNLEVYIFRGWWILTFLIFSQCESSPYVNLGLVNLERIRFISRVKTCWTQKLIVPKMFC